MHNRNIWSMINIIFQQAGCWAVPSPGSADLNSKVSYMYSKLIQTSPTHVIKWVCYNLTVFIIWTNSSTIYFNLNEYVLTNQRSPKCFSLPKTGSNIGSRKEIPNNIVSQIAAMFGVDPDNICTVHLQSLTAPASTE